MLKLGEPKLSEQKTVSLESRTNHTANAVNEPIVGEIYWVKCRWFKTKAIALSGGNWKCVFDDKRLPDVIEFWK